MIVLNCTFDQPYDGDYPNWDVIDLFIDAITDTVGQRSYTRTWYDDLSVLRTQNISVCLEGGEAEDMILFDPEKHYDSMCRPVIVFEDPDQELLFRLKHL